MADFEDALSPTWVNILGGHYSLIKAVKQDFKFQSKDGSKTYNFASKIRTQIMVRPRSLARVESRLLIDETPVSATLFDIVVYAFHN